MVPRPSRKCEDLQQSRNTWHSFSIFALRLLCVLKSYSKLWFTLRNAPHLLEGLGSIFLLKRKKIRIIYESLVSLEFIFKPKSHIFHFTYKYFLKGISYVPKTSQKNKIFVSKWMKMTQKTQKVNKLRLSCMSLMIKNCKFLKIPIGKLPIVYCMYEKNRKNRLKTSEKLLIQPRVVGGGVIFHYRGIEIFLNFFPKKLLGLIPMCLMIRNKF